MRCWRCDVEPERLVDVTTLDAAEPEYLPVWPARTDHEHVEQPPTPGELEQAGHEALSRIYSAASG